MDIESLIKISLSLATVFGSIVAALIKTKEAKKMKVDLLEKLDSAVTNNNKNTALEIFTMLYGVSLNYNDLVRLLKRDDCRSLITLLKKKKSAIKFEDDDIVLTEYYKKKWVQNVDFIMNLTSVTTSLIIVLGLTPLLVSSDNAPLIAFCLVLISICSFWFAQSLEQLALRSQIKSMGIML